MVVSGSKWWFVVAVSDSGGSSGSSRGNVGSGRAKLLHRLQSVVIAWTTWTNQVFLDGMNYINIYQL